MKYHHQNHLVLTGVFVVLLVSFSAVLAVPISSAFTYQGQLKRTGSPVNDTVNLTMTLWDRATEGNSIGLPDLRENVEVVNGLFSVQLDFGGESFNGNARWLQIVVRTSDGTSATLSPRQPLTAAPYALQTRGLFVDDVGSVGVGTTSPSFSVAATWIPRSCWRLSRIATLEGARAPIRTRPRSNA